MRLRTRSRIVCPPVALSLLCIACAQPTKDAAVASAGVGCFLPNAASLADVGAARRGSVSERASSVADELVRAGVHDHDDDVRECYSQALRNEPTLRGQVIIQFHITTDGRVDASRVHVSTLRRGNVEDCIAKLACAWRFAVPSAGGPRVVTYAFDLAPAAPPSAEYTAATAATAGPPLACRPSGRKTLQEWPSSPPDGGETSPLTSAKRIEKEGIGRVIQRGTERVRACYEPALASQPELAGGVLIQFVIAADGLVDGTRIHSSTLRAPAVESCLLRESCSWKFERPLAEATVVTFPFLFSPVGAAQVRGEVVR